MIRHASALSCLALAAALLLGAAATAAAPDRAAGLDLVLLFDRQQGLTPPDPAALAAFLGSVRPGQRVAFVAAGEEATVLRPLAAIEAAESRTTAYEVRGKLAYDAPYTDLLAGLEAALDLLKTRTAEQPKRAVIVLGAGSGQGAVPSDGGPGDRAGELLERFLLEEVAISAVAAGPRCAPFLARLTAGSGGRCVPAGEGDPAGDGLGVIFDSLRLQAIEHGKPAAEGDSPDGEDYSFLDEQKTIKEIGEEAEDRAAAPAVPTGNSSPLLTVLVVAALLLGVGLLALVLTMRQKLLAVLELHGDLEAISKDRSSPSFNRLSLGMTQFNKLFDEAERKLQALSLDLEDYGIESWEIEKRLLDNYHSITDSLFLLIDHLEVQVRGGDASAETDWFLMRLRQLLEDENIEPVPVEPGDAFDNRRHASVGERDDPAPAGTVLEVSRPGYLKRQGDNEGSLVLRQAEVIISRGVAAEDTGATARS